MILSSSPTSAGSVQLATASAWDAPIMDPKYVETSHDVDVLVRGVRLALKVARTEPMASFLDHTDRHKELDHLLYLKTDEELKEVIRKRIETLYHPACTARMAPRADGGVVDSKLRVYGVSNLRVCDASAMPTIVSGHTVSLGISVLFSSVQADCTLGWCMHSDGGEISRHYEGRIRYQALKGHKNGLYIIYVHCHRYSIRDHDQHKFSKSVSLGYKSSKVKSARILNLT